MTERIRWVQKRGNLRVRCMHARREAIRERLAQKRLRRSLLIIQATFDIGSLKLRQTRCEQPAVAMDVCLMSAQAIKVTTSHDCTTASCGQGSIGATQPARFPTGRIAGSAIQFAQRFEDLVDRYRLPQTGGRAHGWTGRYCRCIRCPGCEDRALLGSCQPRMAEYILRMVEYRAGMKKRLEIENIVVSGRRPHGCLPV